MLTKEKIKIFSKLKQKKYRDKFNLFIVEGRKIVSELKAYKQHIHVILINNDKKDKLEKLFNSFDCKKYIISNEIFKKISISDTSQGILAICNKYAFINNNDIKLKYLKDNPVFIFDKIQDPGNLGTIIRTADWFGINKIFCSKDTVDLFNPKVIQSSMGSFLRVQVFYVDIENFIRKIKSYCNSKRIIATSTKGKNIYKQSLKKNDVIIFGNEANGIKNSLLKLSSEKISIPKYGGAESLNVAISFSIILSEWVRSKSSK